MPEYASTIADFWNQPDGDEVVTPEMFRKMRARRRDYLMMDPE